MAKFINSPNNVVTEMLDGLVLVNQKKVYRIPDTSVICQKNFNKKQVALISGGGSGHEPAHAGYIGSGMLSAAVCGPVFTSPAPDQIYQAITELNSELGTLLIVKNYTGDVINFEMAKDLAESDGKKCEMVIVDDDIALENSTFTTGKRGIAGTIFVHKLVGAKAQTGCSLLEVKALAEKVIKNVGSYGMSLNGCTIPGNQKRGFEIPEGEVEIGLGIHGEPGIKREKLQAIDKHIHFLLDNIIKQLSINTNDQVAVLVNGLGATSLMELYIIARAVLMYLEDKKINYHPKIMVGNYLTSLDMPGFSLSLLKLDPELRKLFEAPCDALVWAQ